MSQNQPRVLVVAPRLDLGGAELHLLRVLPRLRQSGIDISVFTIELGGRLDDLFKADGVPVFGSNFKGPRALRAVQAASSLRSVISRTKPDILHFFLSEPYLIGVLGSMGSGPQKKIMSRRSLADYQRNHPLLGLVERLMHRSLAALIGNSRAVGEELIRECGESKKVGVIHNGIDLPDRATPESRAEQRGRLGISNDEFVIVVVANLIPYKGHADLVQALASMRAAIGAQWRALLVGRDEGIGAALRQESGALGIANQVEWLGELADPRHVLLAADIGVLPSHEEGFSNSLLEKMACGLPVVATKVGGNVDAILDGESGLLVPARNPAGLAQAILTLRNDPALREKLGSAARARVEQKFNMEACTRRYVNLYRGILRSEAPVSELIDPG